MKSLFTLLLFLGLLPASDFKKEQIKNERVRSAYLEKSAALETRLAQKNVRMTSVQLYLQAFKHERIMVIWVKNRADKTYQMLGEMPFCAGSGRLGPKSKQGDLQVPEGFYYIDRFHPESKFHLSLGINYPNTADRARSKAENLGGDIFIHGKCVSAGCIAITDEGIKELYILTVEAYQNGQEQIPVHIFPARLTNENMDRLTKFYGKNSELTRFWQQLKTGYDQFEQTRVLPAVTVAANGRYQFR